MKTALHITVATFNGVNTSTVTFVNKYAANQAKDALLNEYKGLDGCEIRVVVMEDVV